MVCYSLLKGNYYIIVHTKINLNFFTFKVFNSIEFFFQKASDPDIFPFNNLCIILYVTRWNYTG